MQIKVLGKRWNLRFVPNLSARGLCDDPQKTRRQIRIWQGVRGDEELMEVVVHELLHAAGWHIDEAFVDQFAKDAARVLTTLGYARIKE